ncbi:hypothetical protein JCM8115_001412 [Rhodotorula mucilaginosa]
MASAVASTSAYVFPSAHEPPPPPPPAPPVQQQPVAPATPAPAAAGALDEDSEFSDYQGDDDDDDDEDDDQLSDGERAERKRRRKDQLDGVSLGSGDSPGLSGGRLKRYPCPHPGCIKCYTRPIRLEEHLRSHTGERPFKCEECGATFIRDSHLKAHARSHLSDSAKEYACEICDKRFWTNQHLKKHLDMVHDGKGYDCTQCGQHFRKHRDLRNHTAETHAPPGTKPFMCTHPGCTNSFNQSAHLKSHLKTHDLSRYACLNPKCADKPIEGRQFGTWSELQRHNKAEHPPTCPYPECNDQVFTNKRGLRNHLASHERRAAILAAGGVPRGPVFGGGGEARKKRARARVDEKKDQQAAEAEEARRNQPQPAFEWRPVGPPSATMVVRPPAIVGLPGTAAAAGGKPSNAGNTGNDEEEVDQLASDYYDEDDHQAPGLDDDHNNNNRGGWYAAGGGGGGNGYQEVEEEVEDSEWEARQEQERDDRMREDFRHGGKKKRKVLLEAAGFPPLSYALPPPPPPPSAPHPPPTLFEPAEPRLPVPPPVQSPAPSKYLDLVTGANYAAPAAASTSDPHPRPNGTGSGTNGGLPVDSAVILNGTGPHLTTGGLVRKYPCPFPAILSMPHKELVVGDALPGGQEEGEEGPDDDESSGLCRYWFKRVYDVERHLRARHGVEMDGGREVLDAWFQADKRVAASATA